MATDYSNITSGLKHGTLTTDLSAFTIAEDIQRNEPTFLVF